MGQPLSLFLLCTQPVSVRNKHIHMYIASEAVYTHAQTYTQGWRERMYCLGGLATLQTILHISALTSITLGVLSVRSPTACNKHQAIEIFLAARVTCKIHFTDSRIFQAKSLVRLGQTDTRKWQRVVEINASCVDCTPGFAFKSQILMEHQRNKFF